MRHVTSGLAAWLIFGVFAGAADAASTPVWERTNPGGGGAFLSIEARNGTVVVGSDLSGAYISKPGLPAAWTVIGPNQNMTATHVSEVAFHPDDINGKDLLFLGTDDGIFRSDDGGDSFVHALDLSVDYQVAYVTDIQVVPANHDLLYAAVHVGFWGSPLEARIYRSADRGASWSFAGGGGLPGDTTSCRHQIVKLVLDPVDPFAPVTMYGVSGNIRELDDDPCTLDNAGRLYKSTDGGKSWTRMVADKGPVMDFILHPADPSSMYLSTYDGQSGSMDGSIWRATGGGDWQEVRSGYSGVLLIDAHAPDTVRVIDPRQQFAWERKAGAWETTNAWSATPAWHRLPAGFSSSSCTRYPSSVFATRTSPVCNWDHFWLANTGPEPQAYFSGYAGYIKTLGKDVADPDRLLWVNAQWVFSSTDGGGVFDAFFTTERAPGSDEWRSLGVDNVNMLDIAVSEQNSDLVFAGFFDLGCWRSTDGGDYWQSCNVPGSVANPFYPGESFGWKKASGGSVATLATDPGRADYVWMSMSPNQRGAEPTYLLRSTRAGERDSWEAMADDGSLPLREIIGLSTDHRDLTTDPGPRTLFVTADGRVYRSDDDGVSWGAAPVFDCDCGCRFTAVDHLDKETVYAGGEAGLFVSEDGGTSWNTILSQNDTGMPAGTDFCAAGWSGIYEGDWRGVFDIETDPYHEGIAFVTVYGKGKGLYRIDRLEGGGWNATRLRTDNYMRGVAVFSDPYVSLIYATSSSTLTNGSIRSSSNGVFFSTDDYYHYDESGLEWHDGNDGMAWRVAIPVTVGPGGMLFTGSPGTGFQRARVVCTDDSDCDGLANDFELSIGTDAGDADSDDDGVDDGVEVGYDGNASDYNPDLDLDPLAVDSDGDTFSDALEIAWSSNPLNVNSGPLLGDLNNDGVVSAGDVILAQRIVLGTLVPDAFLSVIVDVAPSYNGVPFPDGAVNAADVMLIMNMALGSGNF